MKKSIILLLAIMATMTLSAQQYALHFGTVDGPVVAAGDTVEYTTTDMDMNVTHMAFLYIYIENLTMGNLVTDNLIEVAEGPSDLITEICAGGNCPQQGVYTLVPGDNPDMPLTIEPHLLPEYGGQHILYRITVGEGVNLENSITVYVKVNMSLSAQKYALHFGAVDGPVIAAGDTAEYTTTDMDMNVMHMAFLYVYIENLTMGNLETFHEIAEREGPASLVTDICAGGSCPWDSNTYTLVPGDNSEMPLTIEPHLLPEYGGQHILYRITVGEGENLENSITVYVKVNVSATSGINRVVNHNAVKVYPNPTRGKVTVGNQQYDLSGRAAGVYYLPAEGGAARVIKL